jgi:Leucine-rich repeat (LRR) protein
MTSLETVKLAGNPKLDFGAVCEILRELPVKELSFTTDQPIPENLGALSQLESLTLDGFTTPKVLPESMGRMQKLRSLLILGDAAVVLPEALADVETLSDVRVRTPECQLPARFYKWSKVSDLDLSNCRFTRLPEEMARMTAITSLMLGGRQERDYAQVFGVVGRLPNLARLDLVMSCIPEGVAACRNIGQLIVWAGGGNPVVLPEALFTLPQLRSLVVYGGKLDAVPEGIGRMSALETVAFREGEYGEMPTSIGALQITAGPRDDDDPCFRYERLL